MDSSTDRRQSGSIDERFLHIDAITLWRVRGAPYALTCRDEMGYEAAVSDRAASHDAPAASSFLYLISARG